MRKANFYGISGGLVIIFQTTNIDIQLSSTHFLKLHGKTIVTGPLVQL